MTAYMDHKDLANEVIEQSRAREITDGVHRVLDRIAEAESVAGREAGSVHLLAATKTRDVGEILAAIDAGVHRIGENRPQEIIVKAPKTKAGNRHVYFSAEMESLLREYEAFCAAETERYDRRKQTKDDYVFRRKGMKLPMTPSTFTWRFKKILKANDLPTDLNVHSLRHTAASLFIASGTDVGTVAGLLGHSQPSTTLDIYTHAFDKNKKTASQIMQSSLEI